MFHSVRQDHDIRRDASGQQYYASGGNDRTRHHSATENFLNNTISVNQLSQAMKLGELGEQVVLKSEKAFGQIRFQGYEIADGSIYNPRRMAREDRARKAYLTNHGADFSVVSNEIYVLDIIREGMKNDDPRLR